MSGTTENEFLGGRLTLLQPRNGYRAGVDPVLLAAAVQARSGQSVLDLGCGVGTALFCLMLRVEGLDATGIEVQPDLCALAQSNAERNGLVARIVAGDIADMPVELKASSFDHVIANPPFFDRARSSAAAEPGREVGRGEAVPLSLWLDVGIRRLKPGGRLTFIQRAERLGDLLAGLGERMGGVVVTPLAPRAGRDAGLVIVGATKGARAALRIEAPFVLHDGDHHERDGDSYSASAQAVLRDGQALADARFMLR